MEKHSAAYAARKQRMIDAFNTTRTQMLYSTGVSEKQKRKIKNSAIFAALR